MSSICQTGSQQSPIDIITNQSIKCDTLCDLLFYYRNSAINLKNTGRNLVLNYDDGSYVMYDNEVFELDKISFFTPSAHKIDGRVHPIEINLNHRSPNTGQILIISVFCEVNRSSSRSSSTFETFTNHMPLKKNGKTTLQTNDEWNIYNAIPSLKAFYTYKGSLPRPPCIEGVRWIAFENIVNCSKEFYENLKNITKNNTRLVKKLGTRKIYYNHNASKKNNQNYGSEFRCYTSKEFSNSCSSEQQRSANSSAKKQNNYQSLLMVIIMSLIATICLILFYVYSTGDFGKVAKTLQESTQQLTDSVLK